MISPHRPSFVLLALLFGLAIPSTTDADVWHFTGTSTLLAFGGPPDFGTAGEQITVSFDLDPDDFYRVNVANPVFDYFEPISTAPVHVTGSVTGVFPNVSSIERIMALELTESQNNDLLVIENHGGNLFDSFCRRSTCFNGAIRPNTPAEMFDLLERAVVDASRWRMTTANPSVGFNGGADNIVLKNDIVWSVSRTPPTPYTQIDIVAAVDGQYTAQTGVLDTTSTTALVGVDSTQRQAWMEFSLAAIPANAIIEQAQLELRGFVSSGAPSLEIRRYAGNGALTLADGTATSRIIAGTGPVSMDTGLLLDLDAAEISDLLGTASHLGLRLRGLDPIDYVGFYTREATVGPPPTLIIRYSLPALAGDYNEDGTVDAADYTVWRDRLGSPNSLPNDDTAGVNPADYDRWKSQFGDSQGAGAGNLESVPEPAAWVLALVGIAWSLRVRPLFLRDA